MAENNKFNPLIIIGGLLVPFIIWILLILSETLNPPDGVIVP